MLFRISSIICMYLSATVECSGPYSPYDKLRSNKII